MEKDEEGESKREDKAKDEDGDKNKTKKKVEECSAEQERKQTRCQALVAIACPMPRTQKNVRQGQSCRSVGKALEGIFAKDTYMQRREGR